MLFAPLFVKGVVMSGEDGKISGVLEETGDEARIDLTGDKVVLDLRTSTSVGEGTASSELTGPKLGELIGSVPVASVLSGERSESTPTLVGILNELLSSGDFGEGMTARPMTEADIDEWLDSELSGWQDTLDPAVSYAVHRANLEIRIRSRLEIVPDTTIVVLDDEGKVVIDTVSFLTNTKPEDTKSWVDSTGQGTLRRHSEGTGLAEILDEPDGSFRYIMSLSNREHPGSINAVDAIVTAYKMEVAQNPNLQAAIFVSRIPSFKEWVDSLFEEVTPELKEDELAVVSEILSSHDSSEDLVAEGNEGSLKTLLDVYITPTRGDGGEGSRYRDPLMFLFALSGARVVKGVVNAMEYDIASLHTGAVFEFRADE